MTTSSPILSLLSAIESHDFLVTVLVAIAGVYVAVELLLSRASARFRGPTESNPRPPNSLP